ncbi:MAG: molybdopterin-binding protein [Thermohalobaculum sp.]|nr:molybdopterin-binding protein [Thermohalobaculum sp.]
MRGRLRDDCFALPPGIEWTPVDVALARLRAGLDCVAGVEEVALADAAGRILAAPVIARRANPPAANAAVDGYAFAFASLGGADEARLPLAAGRAAAGRPLGAAVPPGHAVRILTGAEIPEGADTVVLQEDCEVADGHVLIGAPRKRGANTRAAGEDAAVGEAVLDAGRRLGPQDLARIASVGVARVAVHRRLRVAVLSTGDEVIEPGVDGPGIFDANRPMLMAFLAAQGFEPVDLGRAPDRAERVAAALDRGAAGADAILTTGGASDGDEDHVSKLMRAEGRVETWRIAVKPGRPLALGLWRGVPVFGLPGNPVAAFVCALIFARPALMLMAGAGWAEPEGVMLPAAFDKRKKPGRREYLRARLDADGRVEVFRSEGSGLIGGLSWATGLCELPDGALDVVPGTPVRFLPFAAFGI